MKKLLGYNIFGSDETQLIDYVTREDIKKIHIVSGNPEVLSKGLEDKQLFDNFTSKYSVIIPDGIGLVLAAKIKKIQVKEKIAGIEVFIKLLENAEKQEKRVYLLGSSEKIVEETVKALKKNFKKLNIVGFRNGFFDLENCHDIVDEINHCKADFLFVAMGAPRQEKFISKYFDDINCRIFMGVGGSFDVIAGKVNRAPKWMINLGFEWLYRVLKEPFRIKRLSVIPRFILKAIIEK